MLEIIQQKSMHRKSETGGLTSFSKAGAAVRLSEENPQEKTNVCSRIWMLREIDHRAAVQKTERHVNQLLHSGAGDFTANNDHAVAEYSERKTDPMFSLRVD